ncbi:MAG: GNAT family N-acetyltransferase [Ruminococcaceae bacterium]|nr:GNAT family N-acetyltransferase [Oscillospiraceae bacterium]
MLTHYKNQSCEELIELLKGDEITFSVLFAILRRRCTDIFTDHENVILCYSNAPFPVWVWCKDMADTKAVELIGACIKDHFPFEKGHYHIMIEKLWQALKNDSYFENTYIDIDMLSYRLDNILPVDKIADGKIELADTTDIDIFAGFFHDFELEAEGIDHEMEYCREHMDEAIERNQLFAWRNEQNQLVAMTQNVKTDNFARLSAVYTAPEYRRKGYAYNLVHSLCKTAVQSGMTPILYADSSYGPSNECYKKIGFTLVDRLCHIRKYCK